ncbi:MAG: 5'-deoxynucleotidase [Gammaproteobacteria bacterium]|nr:MAG: 5'-deoxynucleotidase [Gammaproteobacteria bacterium]
MAATSKFFAYLERLRWIKRWGLKRNVVEENVMEHSWQVATISHVLAVIHQKKFNGDIDPGQVATAALYHDVSEIITGDLPSPIKYHSDRILTAYRMIEREAEEELLGLLPLNMQADFADILIHENINKKVARFVKAADLISAFLKCRLEVNSGNHEFDDAQKAVEEAIRQLSMPEVDYFMTTFVDSYLLTLDELLKQHDKTLKGA